MKMQHKSQKDLCEYLNISKQAFTEWKGGRNNSYVKHLPKIAEYLDVSVDYLLGKTNEKKSTPTESADAEGLEVLKQIRELSPEKQKQVFDYVRFLSTQKED